MSAPQDNSRERLLGGRAHQPELGDLRWVTQQPGGNATVKLFSYALRKVFRHSLQRVTFDADSFTKAVASVPSNTPLVIIPVHRSYYDFLFCSYLFYAHPELGISLPKIAAAEEFGQVPVLGRLLNQAGAFYIRRGQGKEDMQLTDQVHSLVQNRETFEFFIEGQRSRAREFLPPKRGLLRCLQGELSDDIPAFALLPIAISYDRLPEERAMLQELTGGPKPRMSLPAMSGWAVRLLRGKIRLGRIHICCAPPLSLDRNSNIPELAQNVMASLQSHTYSSDFHHAAFTNSQTQLKISAAEFKALIEARGGLTLDSQLPADDPKHAIPEPIERSLRYHWLHLFCPEALAMQPNNPALQHYCKRHDYLSDASNTAKAAKTPSTAASVELLSAIFAPVMADYQRLATSLRDWLHSQASAGSEAKLSLSADQLLQSTSARYPHSDLTTLRCALDGLVAAKLLQVAEPDEHGKQQYAVIAETTAIDRYIQNSAWPAKLAP